MASAEEIKEILDKLRSVLDLLTPGIDPMTVVDLILDVLSATTTPPPGDPAELESVAGAYRTAASAIAPIATDVRSLATTKLPEAWEGGAATNAATIMSATANAIGRTPPAFTDAAKVLDELAGKIRAHQKEHGELRQALNDAQYDASHIKVKVGIPGTDIELGGDLPVVDPTALGNLIDAVVKLVTGCIRLYQDSLNDADRAASRFADIESKARAGAAAQGGIAADDAVVLAELSVGSSGVDDGILTQAQLSRAGAELDKLSAADRARFEELLAKAGTDKQRAWLLKALTAGHGVAELTGFAEKIRGQSDAWLDEHLTLIDQGSESGHWRGGVLVEQQTDTTCGTTSLIVARAMNDPLYALSLTEGDFEKNLEAETERLHDETNTVWPEDLGTSPMGMADSMSKNTGTEYGWELVNDYSDRDISSTMRDVVTAAEQGHPVPVLVGDNVPRHYVLVTGYSDGNVMVYNPANGSTTSVPEQDFLSGNLKDSAGFSHVRGVVTPKG